MALLEVEDLSVSFGGVHALSRVSMSVEAGTLAGLIGPNGAGKSTLLGVLSGLINPQKGRVLLDGRDITGRAPHRRAQLGMARTFQRLELWGSMSVLDNVRTAAEFATAWNRSIDPPAVAAELVDRLGLTTVANTLTSDLPSGLGRVTEVARAMASSPRLLLLDEPSAGLDDHESRQLADTLSALAADGTAILLVEHHVDMVMRACGYIWVLDFGALIADGMPADVRAAPAVQAAYLGSKHVASA
jgi:branched-chain amino acid transport system ATP-binding protein